MSTAELAAVANNDTPSSVKFPQNGYGVFAWLVGKFGPLIITVVILAYAANRVYSDDHALIDRVMAAFEKRAEVDSQLAQANEKVAQAIKEITDEIKASHLRASGKNEK